MCPVAPSSPARRSSSTCSSSFSPLFNLLLFTVPHPPLPLLLRLPLPFVLLFLLSFGTCCHGNHCLHSGGFFFWLSCGVADFFLLFSGWSSQTPDTRAPSSPPPHPAPLHHLLICHFSRSSSSSSFYFLSCPPFQSSLSTSLSLSSSSSLFSFSSCSHLSSSSYPSAPFSCSFSFSPPSPATLFHGSFLLPLSSFPLPSPLPPLPHSDRPLCF